MKAKSERKRRVCFLFGGGIVLFLIIGSCSTLPLPGTPDESLLIFAYNIEETWQHGNITVKSVDIQVENKKTKEVKTISFQPGDHYKSIASEPGQYIIKKVVVANQWQNDVNSKWFDTHHYYDSLYLSPRTIYLYRKLFNFRAQKQGDGYNLNYFGTNKEKREDILTSLQKNDHWLAWEEYTLYGF